MLILLVINVLMVQGILLLFSYMYTHLDYEQDLICKCIKHTLCTLDNCYECKFQ